MFKKILLAYNGSREGKSALLAAPRSRRSPIRNAPLAVAGMPSSMFLTEGFLPEELLEEEKKRAQEVLNEGIAQLKKKASPSPAPRGRRAGRGDFPLAAELKCDLIVVGHSRRPRSARAGGAARWERRCWIMRRAVFLWRRRGIENRFQNVILRAQPEESAFRQAVQLFPRRSLSPCVLTGLRPMSRR